MLSYWEKKSFFFRRDVIICGAGFTGLSTAIYLKKENPHSKVLILEKDPVNGGASTKNAGFACFGSPSELIADLAISSEDEVFSLVEKRWRGLQNLRSLLGDDAIAYEHKHGFELFKKDDFLFADCAGRLDELNRQLASIVGRAPYRRSDHRIVEFGLAGVDHIIENTEEGQVDTGKMYRALYNLALECGVDILHGIRVESYEEGESIHINTAVGNISCDQFLIATNGFASELIADTDTRPARAQVLVTTPVQGLKIQGCFHMNQGYYYFRDIDGRVLFGGGRNLAFREETTTDLELNRQIQEHLEKILSETILPGQTYEIESRWCGIMGMGREKQVIMKQLSERVFCAVRLSGMGLALSTLLGREMAAMMRA